LGEKKGKGGEKRPPKPVERVRVARKKLIGKGCKEGRARVLAAINHKGRGISWEGGTKYLTGFVGGDKCSKQGEL